MLTDAQCRAAKPKEGIYRIKTAVAPTPEQRRPSTQERIDDLMMTSVISLSVAKLHYEWCRF